MQKLDSEKFRAVLEAMAAEKAKRRKPARAKPRVAPQTGMPLPPDAFEALSDNRALMVEFKRGLPPPFLRPSYLSPLRQHSWRQRIQDIRIHGRVCRPTPSLQRRKAHWAVAANEKLHRLLCELHHFFGGL